MYIVKIVHSYIDIYKVTITQATAELPMLVKKLQTGEESVVYIKQDGRTVAQLTLSEDNRQTESKVDVSKRIGIAKGKFKMPKDFDKWDKDIEEMFGDTR